MITFHGRSLNLNKLSANTIWLSLTNRVAKPAKNDRGITFSERDTVWQVRFVNLLVAVAPRAAEARFLQLQFLFEAFGKVAMIDAADFVNCAKHTWRLNQTYVQTKVSRRDIALYRLVLGPDIPNRVKPVYHDGDCLNCRRANLSILNSAHAAAAVRKTSNKTTSDYKGVSWVKVQWLWRAAAKAYDEGARELFGQHAALNFPGPESGRRPDPQPPSLKRVSWTYPSPRRKCPVWDPSNSAICSGVPTPNSRPPALPPSGPKSTTQSAARITSKLCSINRIDPPLWISR